MVVEGSGYPLSVRCLVEFDDARELILIPAPPPGVVGRQGLACLLFHRHNADLGGQHALLIKGELREEAGTLVLHPGGFLTGSGRQDTDRMPIALADGHYPVHDAGTAQSAGSPGHLGLGERCFATWIRREAWLPGDCLKVKAFSSPPHTE